MPTRAWTSRDTSGSVKRRPCCAKTSKILTITRISSQLLMTSGLEGSTTCSQAPISTSDAATVFTPRTGSRACHRCLSLSYLPSRCRWAGVRKFSKLADLWLILNWFWYLQEICLKTKMVTPFNASITDLLSRTTETLSFLQLRNSINQLKVSWARSSWVKWDELRM